MSGTSRDGVDAAAMQTNGIEVGKFFASLTIPYSREEQLSIAAACLPNKVCEETYVRANKIVTKAHIIAVNKLIKKLCVSREEVGVIGFHGHTVRHDPIKKITEQIGDAEVLAKETGINVVYDFRSADIKAGGQGAPLVPIFHAALCLNIPRPIAILNLGGVSNVTWVGPDYDIYKPDDNNLYAFDIGPGCALIDDWVRNKKGWLFDSEGKFSKTGVVNFSKLDKLMGDKYFNLFPPKSLDRDYFDTTPLLSLSDADGAATLTRFTVEAISNSVKLMPAPPMRWLITGGGRRNIAIMEGLNDALDAPVDTVESVGWNGDALESQAFAWLAARSIAGYPLSYPQTTGVNFPQVGGRLVCADRFKSNLT
tara:strand:- start:5384 stop:6484 length:1101 start_codon:yes stop_codon:yes gene_type:complete